MRYYSWSVNNAGELTLFTGGIAQLQNQSLVRLIADGRLLEPLKASVMDERITVQFESGNAVLQAEEKDHYLKLTALEVPEGTDALLFGPYFVEKQHYGGLIGAAWNDNDVVCIQSLNPKTVGGYIRKYEKLHPYFEKDRLPAIGRDSFSGSAAVPVEGGVVLQCYAEDMSKPTLHDGGISSILSGIPDSPGAEACKVPGKDAYISGASVALIACEKSELLDIIGDMEIAEGLPHPTLDGIWAKKNPRASESYMMISEDSGSYSYEEMLEIVRKAGLRCIYSWAPFKSWGHFEIDPGKYPGGDEGLKQAVDQAAEKGLSCGFHTLSNFIQTHDPYVSPVPSEHLLVMDTTELTADLGENDGTLSIKEKKNFCVRTHLNVIRIEKELIQFGECEEGEDGWKLTKLSRGTFGTTVSSHPVGTKVYRLQDHGYRTLFPDLVMQAEMADRIGELIRKTGIKRMSFDGMEGCTFTGRGEYACSEFVRRVFAIAGSELLCDASTSSHYRWHAHTYFNWGEPWYDWQGRGGMFLYRQHNQDYFRDNFMNGMLGQFSLRLASDKFEATHPEYFEFMMAETVANDAGAGLDLSASNLKQYGLRDWILDHVRIWEDMRFGGIIPEELREKMKDENANWHLEETARGWKLHRLRLQTYDFGYRGVAPYPPANHAELIVIDRAVPRDVLKIRIRVGQLRNKGQLHYLAFHNGWGGFYPLLKFDGLSVNGGDYLIYEGGLTIRHYDANYNLMNEYQGEGVEIQIGGEIAGVDVHYALTEDSDIEPFATIFQDAEIFEIERKKNGESV